MTDEAAPPEILSTLGLAPVRPLGGRINHHWLVTDRAGASLVLRGGPGAGGRYELDVLRRLHALGWPVPRPLIEPIECGGRVWCLFTHLPGASRVADDPRERGRLLARLHADAAALVDLGQRPGWRTSDVVLRDAALHDAVRRFEPVRPDVGHLLRWHLDEACRLIDAVPLAECPRVVLHSDFTAWNLLFDGDALTGVLDFESTHLNYRVADFALSWRGQYDEVIAGYEAVSPLSAAERALVVPAFWAWLFLGVRQEIEASLAGRPTGDDFAWRVKQFTRRSAAFPARSYPAP